MFLTSSLTACLPYHFSFIRPPGNRASQVAQWQRIHMPMQETQETRVRSLGQEDALVEEKATPLQYSCLGNPMNKGVEQATVNGVPKE